jgi:hypothetical protein
MGGERGGHDKGGGAEFWRLVTSPRADAPTTRRTRAHQQSGLALEKQDRAMGAVASGALVLRRP